MTERDVDALWRSIVENYGERVVLDPDAPEPGAGETAEPGAHAEEHPAVASANAANAADARDERDRLDAWDDPDDHFVPPPPPPLPHPEPPRLLAWAGVLGVPVLTLVLTMFSISVPSWAGLFALVWFVGGIGYLVATMRDDEPDEWDDGAVV